MRIRWTKPARTDLRQIRAFISTDSPKAGARVSRQIVEETGKLARFPKLGREGSIPGTRELVVSGTPFKVIYRVLPMQVEIITVVHGRQLWPPA